MSQNVRLEEMTDVTVSVRHVEEGHVYSYYLAEDEDGRRILSSSPNVRDGNGGHAASLRARRMAVCRTTGEGGQDRLVRDRHFRACRRDA